MHAFGHPGILRLDQQRKGHGGLRARTGPAVVHHGYGILNEVYYPRADIPQIRDLGFIVAAATASGSK